MCCISHVERNSVVVDSEGAIGLSSWWDRQGQLKAYQLRTTSLLHVNLLVRFLYTGYTITTNKSC